MRRSNSMAGREDRTARFGRNELPIGRIVARTWPENTSAIRLAERVGFEMTAAGLLVLKAEAHI